MPIVINRSTGIADIPKITPEQSESLLGIIIRAYIEKHPDVLESEKQE